MNHGKSSMMLVLVFASVISSLPLTPHRASGNDLIQACIKPNGDVHLIGEEFNPRACRGKEELVEWLAGFELEGSIVGLESRVETLEGQSATKDEVTDLADRVTALETRVEALEQAANGLAVFDSQDNKVGNVISVTDDSSGGISRVLITFAVEEVSASIMGRATWPP